jgi:DNA-binding NtrC family response regulator
MSEETAAVLRREAVPTNILIVDDEQTIRETCVAVSEQTGMKAMGVGTAEEALDVLEHSAIDILLTDLKLPGTSGLELIRRVHDAHPHVVVVVLSQYGTIDSAVEATRMGAIDYVTKPFRIEELASRLERVAHAVELQQENATSGIDRRRSGGLRGAAAGMPAVGATTHRATAPAITLCCGNRANGARRRHPGLCTTAAARA